MGVTAGVVSNGRTAAEALAANNAAAGRMIDAVRKLGVAPTDVRTSELSVNPVMQGDDDEESTRPPKILGYVARNSVELQLRDLSAAPSLIDALFRAGANTVSGPNFSLADPKPAERQARRQAVTEAREEAETYAEAFGMRIARVIRASERSGFDSQGAQAIIVTGSRVRQTPIEPGELTTGINLWVDYALVPR